MKVGLVLNLVFGISSEGGGKIRGKNILVHRSFSASSFFLDPITLSLMSPFTAILFFF